MKYILPLLLALGLSALATATEVAICENAQGERSFRQYCLPGTTQVGTQEVSNVPSDRNAHIKPMIYIGEDCQACIAVFEYLSAKNIAFEEKNIEGDVELQKELNEMAGELRVPITIIGDTQISGYNPAELEAALLAVGYKE